jgi:hypothetical protein
MAKKKPYVQNQDEVFAISRSKIENFVQCPRCFVLDRRHKVAVPSGPSFTINTAVDSLLKKEFDVHRAAGTVHPVLQQLGVDLVPFKDPKIDEWRENFKGVRFFHEPTNLEVFGAVDDLWVDSNGVITVVDYKATGRPEAVTSLPEGGFNDSYRRQLEIYQWLLRKNGFEVSDTAYWLYTTATQKQDGFNNALQFESHLVSHQGDTNWIGVTLDSIYRNLNEPEVAGPSDDCDLCRYFDQRANLAIEWHELVWQNCDNCGSRMLKTISGMMSGPPAAGHVSLGCIVSPEDPDWICPKCDLDEDDEEEL